MVDKQDEQRLTAADWDQLHQLVMRSTSVVAVFMVPLEGEDAGHKVEMFLAGVSPLEAIGALEVGKVVAKQDEQRLTAADWEWIFGAARS